MAYVNATSLRQATVLAKANAALETLLLQIKQRRMYRKTFNALNEMSNRDLADLGLSRSELRHVAWTTSRRDVFGD
ncbi:MAG: DUF1127 domain-containing protein [Pseudomonadota bacterium]